MVKKGIKISRIFLLSLFILFDLSLIQAIIAAIFSLKTKYILPPSINQTFLPHAV